MKYRYIGEMERVFGMVFTLNISEYFDNSTHEMVGLVAETPKGDYFRYPSYEAFYKDWRVVGEDG